MKTDAFSKCHPLVNFIFFLGAIGFGMVLLHPAYIAVGLLCGAGYACVLQPRRGLRLALGLAPAVLFVGAINPLFNFEGQRILFYLFYRPYTLEALLYGLAVGGILAVSMLWFSCYSSVLTSDKFLALFGSRIPALSLLLTMILRLIPSLTRKARQILTARQAIGKGLGEHASKKQQLRSGMGAISALTDWALEGSIVTADSMRSRGYGTARRTSFRRYRFTPRDGIMLGAMLVLAGLTLAFGHTGATYTPALAVPAPGWGLAAYLVFLLIPILVDGKEALLWHISRSKI